MNICEHIQKHKFDKGLTTYRIIQAYFVSCVAASSKEKKTTHAYCHICHTKRNRLQVCLSCIYFGCYEKRHMRNHALAESHDIAVDIKSGNTFCYKCDDFIYDEEFEDIAMEFRKKFKLAYGYETYRPWEPRLYEIQILKENSGYKKISENSYFGLRGLSNLGNTCFMNCILQVLVHTPLLRDYFLSDKHICHLPEIPSTCIACEMFNVFQEFYSGVKKPHIPYNLVYLIWQHAKYLIGFDQQDAHEFLMAILDGLHAHCQIKAETEDKRDLTVDHCNCIIHQAFTGSYQSVVLCSKCSYVSTAFDPFWDISLDLGESSGNKNAVGSNAESLVDCLKRYTHPESLHCTPCSHCHAFDSTMKQLTIKKLPVVVCFHLKRLATANSGQKACNKNTTHVKFPEFLDMSPFLSTTCGERKNISNGTNSKDLHKFDCMFTLFGVVSHRGDQSGGHYIAYVRQQRDRWFLCDDDIIVNSSLEDVLRSEVYLLFYHKKILDHEKQSAPN